MFVNFVSGFNLGYLGSHLHYWWLECLIVILAGYNLHRVFGGVPLFNFSCATLVGATIDELQVCWEIQVLLQGALTPGVGRLELVSGLWANGPLLLFYFFAHWESFPFSFLCLPSLDISFSLFWCKCWVQHSWISSTFSATGLTRIFSCVRWMCECWAKVRSSLIILINILIINDISNNKTDLFFVFKKLSNIEC